MPTASTEHPVDRRQQILDAAQRCFMRNGLHGTSMADVAREAGLPEPDVDRYFTDRDDLVRGIAENILELVTDFFEGVLKEEPIPPLGEVVERFADTVIAISDADGPGRLAPIYWASALYNEQMADRARAPIHRGRAGWTEIVERERAAGRVPAGADPGAVGSLLVCLLPGIVLQRVLFGDVDPETFRRGVRDLLRSVAEGPGAGA
ncbi:MAG: TetR family transcriptional regulator [Streptosporangiales bacterium]|nr:TetR family transcriptional regulator [Streptosporangiales bacterium]